MYKSFFGLKENPFNVNPDPRFLFLTQQIEEALTGLMYGIQTRKGSSRLPARSEPAKRRSSTGFWTGCTTAGHARPFSSTHG